MKQTCILILGMHRSGTSALTGVLNLLDVYLGNNLMKAGNANKKGYFENNELFKINEFLLKECHSSWNDAFYNEDKLQNIKNIDKLKNIIKKEFEYSKVFAIKDPRLAFLFPVYKKVLEELKIDIKIILPYRNPLEVANSLYNRDSMSIEKGMLLWVYHFLLAEKHSRDYDRVFVSFNDLMSRTEEVVKEISKALDIDLNKKYIANQQKIISFLEPDLKHHNIAIDNLSSNVPIIIQKIIVLQKNFNNRTIFERFDNLSNEFFSYQKLFYNNDILNITVRLQEMEGISFQKEQNIKSLNEEVANKEQNIKSLNEEVANKEQNIKSLNEELANKEQNIKNLNEELANKEQSIKSLNEELANKEQSIQEKNLDIALIKQRIKFYSIDNYNKILKDI